MQLPHQQDWSPVLLSELQRAVPVLENSSFDPPADLEAGNSTSDQSQGAQLVASSAVAASVSHAASGQSAAGSNRDFLSDDAMALPMSTLTSGHRRTYPNRGTFQAHVCCIMDPMQVDSMLERVKDSPQFQQARCWPHAYRVISPFDRQTRQGSDDDGDHGAGEKMLDLLCRMGLENLLLIVSHWDTGASNRLGAELFRCVNEQCKTLLMELQQAVRASFPPEEFLDSQSLEGSRLSPRSGSYRHDEGSAAATCFQGVDEANDFDAVFGDEALSNEPMAMAVSSSINGELGSSNGQEALAPVPLDLQALGILPPAQMIWATRFYGAFPQRSRPKHFDKGIAKAPQSPRALHGRRCPLALRETQQSPCRGVQRRLIDDLSYDGEANFNSSASDRFGEGQLHRPAVPSDFRNGPGDVAVHALAMSRMASGELLQLASHLRAERGELHTALDTLSHAADAIGLDDKHLHVSFYDSPLGRRRKGNGSKEKAELQQRRAGTKAAK